MKKFSDFCEEIFVNTFNAITEFQESFPKKNEKSL
jgi:hypothetical protein